MKTGSLVRAFAYCSLLGLGPYGTGCNSVNKTKQEYQMPVKLDVPHSVNLSMVKLGPDFQGTQVESFEVTLGEGSNRTVVQSRTKEAEGGYGNFMVAEGQFVVPGVAYIEKHCFRPGLGDAVTRYVFDIAGNYSTSGAAMCGLLTPDEIRKIERQAEFAVIETVKEAKK